MDWHLFKLFAIAGTIALTFGAWLYFFLMSERALGLIFSGLAYFAMLGVFSSAYFLFSLFDDFTPRDIAVVTILSIVFIILIYALANLLQILQRGIR